MSLKVPVFLVLICGVLWTLALDKDVTIVREEREDNYDGSYKFFYETSDGQMRREEGRFIQTGIGDPELVVTGEYSYFGPDGKFYSVSYTADKNGYRPVGRHLPSAPKGTQPRAAIEPEPAIEK